MKKPRILVVGSFVMDLIVSAPRFPASGESVLGTNYRTAPGGKGANQAVQAARLGANVTMVGKVGADDFGHTLLSTVQNAGVDVQHVLVDTKTSTAIGNVQLEQHNGQTANRIIIVPGANMALTPEDVAFIQEEIRSFDMVMLQLEIPMSVNHFVAKCAYQHGVPVMLNSAPAAFVPEEVMRNLFCISPNEHEAELMTGIPIIDSESAVEAMKALQNLGAQNVLITLGERGMAWRSNNGDTRFFPALKDLPVVDPTAAGDSFVAALCTALAAGLSVEDTAPFATCTAGLTICSMGAMPSLPNLEQVLALMEKHSIDSQMIRQCLL